MIPYSSLPHGYGYFSDPYSSITVNSGGGGSNDYNAAGFNQVLFILVGSSQTPKLRRKEEFVVCYMLSDNVGMPAEGTQAHSTYNVDVL